MVSGHKLPICDSPSIKHILTKRPAAVLFFCELHRKLNPNLKEPHTGNEETCAVVDCLGLNTLQLFKKEDSLKLAKKAIKVKVVKEMS